MTKVGSASVCGIEDRSVPINRERQNRHMRLILAKCDVPVFVTLSGSHLYGFESVDSDWDLRGVHAIPVADVAGIYGFKETIESKTVRPNGETEDELVSHDIGKYAKLLLKNNGYVLEQIFSPFVIYDGGCLAELRDIARECFTSSHSWHYKGFGYSEWRKFVNNPTKPVKRILYVFRVLLSGIHLMETGDVESNLLVLNDRYKLPYVDQLVAEKRSGENVSLPAGHGLDYYTREYETLMQRLIDASNESSLPSEPSPSAKPRLNDLVLRLRGCAS